MVITVFQNSVKPWMNLRQTEQMRLFSDVVAGANVTVQVNKYLRDFLEISGYNEKDSNATSLLFRGCLLTSINYNFEFVPLSLFVTFYSQEQITGKTQLVKSYQLTNGMISSPLRLFKLSSNSRWTIASTTRQWCCPLTLIQTWPLIFCATTRVVI